MIDRFVPPTASRVVDYVVLMTVKLAPQLQEESDQLSDVKQVRDKGRGYYLWVGARNRYTA